MKKISKVALVSAYGRGAYLAHCLQKKGFETTVLDVSKVLPSLSFAEQEGPFGVFLPSHLQDVQRQYLCGNHFHQVSQGFSIFDSAGPLEFQGPLQSYLVKKRKDFQICQKVLEGLFGIPSNFQLTKELKKEFENSMGLLRLSAELTASRPVKELILDVDLSGNIICKEKTDLLRVFSRKKLHPVFLSPLFSDYIFRERSGGDFVELKESLKKEGVKWRAVSTVEALSPSEKELLVWTLSGPETQKYFPKWMSILFPKWQAPQKIWKRFSLSWDQGIGKKILPLLLIVLPQKEGEGILSLKQNPESSSVDLWMQCLYEDRIKESQLKVSLEEAVERLQSLFPLASFEASPLALEEQEYFLCYKNGEQPLSKKVKYLQPLGTGKMDAYSLMQQSEFILWELLSSR